MSRSPILGELVHMRRTHICTTWNSISRQIITEHVITVQSSILRQLVPIWVSACSAHGTEYHSKANWNGWHDCWLMFEASSCPSKRATCCTSCCSVRACSLYLYYICNVKNMKWFFRLSFFISHNPLVSLLVSSMTQTLYMHSYALWYGVSLCTFVCAVMVWSLILICFRINNITIP